MCTVRVSELCTLHCIFGSHRVHFQSRSDLLGAAVYVYVLPLNIYLCTFEGAWGIGVCVTPEVSEHLLTTMYNNIIITDLFLYSRRSIDLQERKNT